MGRAHKTTSEMPAKVTHSTLSCTTKDCCHLGAGGPESLLQGPQAHSLHPRPCIWKC